MTNKRCLKDSAKSVFFIVESCLRRMTGYTRLAANKTLLARTKFNRERSTTPKRSVITFWIDDSAIDAWHCSQLHGRCGRGFEFSEVAIETALVVKGVLSLRCYNAQVNAACKAKHKMNAKLTLCDSKKGKK